MALEASIVERLQDLRRWQVEQQERLLRQQHEQREMLNREQDRMYEALSLSIQDVSFDETAVRQIIAQNERDNLKLKGSDAKVITRFRDVVKEALENIDRTCHVFPQNSNELSYEQSLTEDKCTDENNTSVIQEISRNGSPNEVYDSPEKRADYLETSEKELSAVIVETSKETDRNSKTLSDLPQEQSDVCLNVPDAHLTTFNKAFTRSVRNESDTSLEEPSYQTYSNSDLTRQEQQRLKSTIKGIEPLSSVKSINKYVLIDDIPLPSPKKDFETLLEEKLKDTKAIAVVNGSEAKCSSKKQGKQPFLRKGQGLARFRLNSLSKNSSKCSRRAQSTSSSADVRVNSSKNVKNNSEKPKEVSKISKKSIGTKKSILVPIVTQKNLDLKNVAPPKSKVRNKPTCAFPTSLSSNNNKIKQYDQLNSSDLESKTKRELEEVRIFELLEEKAENSSFCSTSSTVVALLQQSVQSTPLKARGLLEKKIPNMHQQQTKVNIRRSTSEELLLEKIVCSTKSNRVKYNSTNAESGKRFIETDVILSHWDSVPSINKKTNENNSTSCISNLNSARSCNFKKATRDVDFQETRYNDNTANSNQENKLCEFDTDIDPVYEGDQSETDDVDKKNNCNCEEVVENDERNISPHVRFSEYNEYKTIGLTDTSSTSSESQQLRNYSDDRAWSDCSVITDSSDEELCPSKLKVQDSVMPVNREEHNKNSSKDGVTQNEITRVLQYQLEKSLNNKHKRQNIIRAKLVQQRDLNNSDYDTSDMESKKVFLNTDTNHTLSKNRLQDVYENELRELEITPLDHTSDEEHCNFEDRKEFADVEKNNVETEDDVQVYHNSERKASSTNVDSMSSNVGEEESRTVQMEEKNGTIFKSELLKSRLRELEREIDIFRKENTALSIQRQKLQEEHRKLEMQFKEKESSFEENKRQIENDLQEEKKKLVREKAALESRLRDAQQKALQSKRERQEVQSLRDQLDELKEEMCQKESRWNAAQARHRSQVRILQAENSKLKQEIEKLQNSRRSNIKFRKTGVSSNTKALHQINKQLDDRKKTNVKQDLSSDDENRLVQPMMEAIHMKNNTNDINNDVDGSKMIIYENIQGPMGNTESASKKRNLYDNLLKDATMGLSENKEATKKATEEFERLKNRQSAKTDEMTAKTIDSVDSQRNVANLEQTCNNSLNADRKGETIYKDSTDEHNSQTELISHDDKLSCSDHFENVPFYSRNNGKLNRQGIREVQHPDGRIEYWYPNGNVKKISPDRTVAKMIYYNGDVRESNKDGTVKYFYAATRTWHTTMPDGLEILEFPDGQVERRSKDGTIEVSFPDGSVRILQSNGLEKWALPDGTIAETFADDEKILTFPNGQREVHTKDHKRREYPDGTVKLVYPDGSQETRYANGRVRLKDKDGNLLVDSHQ